MYILFVSVTEVFPAPALHGSWAAFPPAAKVGSFHVDAVVVAVDVSARLGLVCALGVGTV